MHFTLPKPVGQAQHQKSVHTTSILNKTQEFHFKFNQFASRLTWAAQAAPLKPTDRPKRERREGGGTAEADGGAAAAGSAVTEGSTDTAGVEPEATAGGAAVEGSTGTGGELKGAPVVGSTDTAGLEGSTVTGEEAEVGGAELVDPETALGSVVVEVEVLEEMTGGWLATAGGC
jgi:hypothetical protein